MKLLFEDILNMSDKWATGMSGRNAGPVPMTLVDMLKKRDHQHPNHVKAPDAMPYAIQPLLQLIGDLYLQADDLKKAIKVAKYHPVLQDRKASHDHLDKIVHKIKVIKKLCKSIGKDIDNFTIEKPDE